MRAEQSFKSSSSSETRVNWFSAKLTEFFTRKSILILPLLVSVACIVIGILSLSSNSLEKYPVPLLGTLGLFLFLLFFYIRFDKGLWDWKFMVFAGVGLASAYFLRMIPEYFYGLHLNGIFHRSLISSLLLLAVAIPTLCYILYYIMGATLKAKDLSYYPIIIIPVALILVAYGILIYKLFVLGIPHLDWNILSTAYSNHSWQHTIWQNDWPTYQVQVAQHPGLANYIQGTLLLILLTAVISLPIGVAVGLYITEYSHGIVAGVIKNSTNALRSISVFILGLAALNVIKFAGGTVLAPFLVGYYYNENGARSAAHGSFLMAAITISMLVIPIIARATEEGCRSLPRDLKEGSLAIGASHTHTLLNIIFPWALPNIVTGLLLGCAEAAGSLATIMFISGTAEYGIGPLNQATSLSYIIFAAGEEGNSYLGTSQKPLMFSAALLIIFITFGLSISALILKRHFSQRYRGT